MKLSNRTIVITGASKGLGKAVALALGSKGVNLILIARSQEKLEQVKNELHQISGKSPLIVPCDISSEEEVQKMAITIKKTVSQVDVLINNAGMGIYHKTENLPGELMRRLFAVNFFGTWYCVKALLPLIKNSKQGYVLNVGSLFSFVALAETSAYAATKFALAGYTEGLRQELKPYGIKVGLFAPGSINTSFHDQEENFSLKTPKAMKMEPERAAKMIVKMVETRRKQIITPKWQLALLKLKAG